MKFSEYTRCNIKNSKKMSNWGEPVPLKWILLETLIDINRNNGKSFITLDEMITIAKHPQIEIHDYQEVLLFLRFQHEVGKVIFFDDINNLIILDPQWLANAFRCLVSDRINIIDKVDDKDKIQIASDMTELTNKGKISDLLIKTLFRLKGGNQFLNQMEDLLRVASFQPSTELGVFCASIRKELIEKVKDIQKRYKLEVAYDEMFKCSDHSDAKSFDLMKRQEDIYCDSCKKPHISKTIYLPWIPERPEIETTPDVTFTSDLDPDYCIGEGDTLQLECSFVPNNVNVTWLKIVM
ncbi:unnamed protein product [Mytilus edulis]|uniref:Ig-like domain-containing protein n=1 Tax=Mytilus edulis TaxID=6550 RepID=A0A8S3ULM8_MYTED|nr:unnamed protein product [Mytilus edulis]